MRQIQSILFVELLGGIGDGVMALPAMRSLARSHPAAHLTVLTFAPGSDLLETDPLIHQVVVAPPGAARSAVDQLLASQQFDLIVSDTNYDGIADAIAHSSAAQVVTNLWRSPPPHERVSDRFLKILLEEGAIVSESIHPTEPQIHLTNRERTIARQALGAAFRPLVFLIPDAGMLIKRWPAKNFVTVGQELQQRHAATIVVPTGSDPDLAAAIVRAIGGTAQVWPRASLRDLAAVLAEADLTIAADTGLAHIAAALQVPTITLFGPSWHDRYGQPAPHINLQGHLECGDRVAANFTTQRCWYEGTCPIAEWQTCLEDISPERVLEAADRLLGRWRDGSKEEPKNSLPRLTAQNPEPRTQISPPPHSLRNILILRLDNIGDVIMTTPTLRALRENLPEAKLTLMTSPGGSLTAPLLPWIDEVLPWRTLWQDLGKLDFDPDREWNLIQTLRDRHFDAALILTSFSQSPHPPALICALAGIPMRVGESKETDPGTLTHAIPPASDAIHQVDRNLRLIEALGFKVTDRALTLPTSPPLHPPTSPYLLLTPWTTCQSRNYAPDRFATAARRLSEITGWSVVLTGVEKDRDRAPELLEILGDRAIDLIGKTSLGELVGLVAQAGLVLTNNTSTMHIADATQTPMVVLFAGTEQPCQWQPRGGRSRLLRRSTVCSPCYAFTCPHELQCLDIPPDAVVQAGLALLQELGKLPAIRVSREQVW